MSAPLKFVLVLAWAGLASLGSAEVPAPAFTGTLTVREVYDDNVFLQDKAPLAAGQTIVALPADADAFITTIGVNLAVAWKRSPSLQLDASYTPEIFRFSRYQSENHTDHRFAASVSGTSGAWRYDAKAGWLSTVGSHESTVFNRLGGSPPVGSEPVRARRAQDIAKASARVTRDFAPGFIRCVFSSMDQDFHTAERSTFGRANYVDRGELSAGLDLGWKFGPTWSAVAGVRQGRQHQANLLGVPLNYTNTLTRWLVGMEGKLNPTSKFSVLAGPDERRFGPWVRPEFERQQTSTYLEAAANWSATKSDLLTLSGKRYLWVSSGARGAYVDALFDVTWKHSFGHAWTLSTGLNRHTAVTSRFNPTAPRDDRIDAVTLALAHAFDAKTEVEFGVAQDRSVSGVPNTPGREYHRRICTLSGVRRW